MLTELYLQRILLLISIWKDTVKVSTQSLLTHIEDEHLYKLYETVV